VQVVGVHRSSPSCMNHRHVAIRLQPSRLRKAWQQSRAE
jgi:hypothetical protein